MDTGLGREGGGAGANGVAKRGAADRKGDGEDLPEEMKFLTQGCHGGMQILARRKGITISQGDCL